MILRDNGDRARQVIPLTTQAPLGSTDPLDLYQWLENYETKTNGQALAIAHNGNLSNGWMFPLEKTYAGGKVDENYVSLRARWEPLYEVTQIKGDGEAHPVLSPDDEFADYGTWDIANLDITELKKPEMLKGEYAREALKRGFTLQDKFGINPYKFGMVGATELPHFFANCGRRKLFRKIHQRRAKCGTDITPLHQVQAGRDSGPPASGIRLPGGVGERKHAQGYFRCDETQGNLCDDRSPHTGTFLRWLGIQ